jgi:hypothetical protein
MFAGQPSLLFGGSLPITTSVSFMVPGGDAMHFHLPKPLHGWRAFAGEVGIIVVGVLIALAAEQGVETWHWREKVARAEDAMRIELATDDGPQAFGRAAIGRCLDRRIGRIHDGAGRVPTAQLRQWIADYQPPVRGWDTEAWKAVLASDIGSHIGAERLIQWSSPYRLIPALADANAREREQVVKLHETLPPEGEPSPEDLQNIRMTAAGLWNVNTMLSSVSQLVLSRIEANGAQVPAAEQKALLARARQIYGDCVEVPSSQPPASEGPDANLIRPMSGQEG